MSGSGTASPPRREPGHATTSSGRAWAAVVPQPLGIVTAVFPPDKIGVAFGVTGPVMALSGVAGPIVAGWLLAGRRDYLGWGSASARSRRASPRPRKRRAWSPGSGCRRSSA